MEDTVREEITEDTLEEAAAEQEDRQEMRDFLARAKFIGAFAAGFAACLAVFAIALNVAHLGRIIPEKDYEYFDDLSNKYGKYYVIMEMIGEDPLVESAPEAITDETIKELVAGLDDPYAEYYTAEEYKEFTKNFTGKYVGIGIVVGDTEEGLSIVQVNEDGPAYGAGLEAGDIIIRVDGIVPEGLDDAVDRMTGEARTEVTVTVSRDGKEHDYTMKRASIDIESVGYEVSEDDPEVGYIRVALFSDDTDEEFERAVKDLQSKGCDKFILDLRQNGGGLTDVSIKMADYLLPACRIMTEVRKDGSEKVYNSKQSSADLDLVVLVDENTASASEILTAAIQENNAGKVIGSRTYGKGVTQVSKQFKDGSAIKLTVNEYLTPKGHHVQGNGIEPDIEAYGEDILDKALEELRK